MPDAPEGRPEEILRRIAQDNAWEERYADFFERTVDPILGRTVSFYSNRNGQLHQDLRGWLFSRLWELVSEAKLDHSRRFEPWLKAIIRNKARDWARSPRARRTQALHGISEPETPRPPESDDRLLAVLRSELAGHRYRLALLACLKMEQLEEPGDKPALAAIRGTQRRDIAKHFGMCPDTLNQVIKRFYDSVGGRLQGDA